MPQILVLLISTSLLCHKGCRAGSCEGRDSKVFPDPTHHDAVWCKNRRVLRPRNQSEVKEIRHDRTSELLCHKKTEPVSLCLSPKVRRRAGGIQRSSEFLIIKYILLNLVEVVLFIAGRSEIYSQTFRRLRWEMLRPIEYSECENWKRNAKLGT